MPFLYPFWVFRYIKINSIMESNIFNRKVSYFEGNLGTPKAVITFGDFLLKCEGLKDVITQIRQTTDKGERARLKKLLPAISTSAVFQPTRSKENIKEYSGLICLDIDGHDNPDLSPEEMMSKLKQMDIVSFASRSAGGQGVFAIVKLAYPERHEEQFNALEVAFKEIGLTIDKQTGDITRLRFATYDPQAWHRPDAIEWRGLYTPLYVPTFTPKPASKKINASSTPSGRQTRTTSTPSDDLTHAEKCVRGLEQRGGASFLNNYDDWLNLVAMPLASLGEAGRELFHRVSRLAPEKYNPSEEDKKFTSLIGSVKDITIASFFDACAKEGISYKDEHLSLAEWKKRYPNVM